MIQDSLYVPSVKWNMDVKTFPSEYDYYSDTLSIDFRHLTADFCFDEDSNRLILILDDEDFQFAYLNLSELE